MQNTTATQTIAQTLRTVKRLKGKLGELSQRASSSVSHEAGKQPHFEFDATRKELENIREELVLSEAAVAEANATTRITFEGRTMTLAEAIRRLQEIKSEIAWVTGLNLHEGTEHVQAGFDWDEMSHRRTPQTREVTYVTHLKETDRADQIDALRNRFERLNDAVETANHRTTVPILQKGSDAEAS
jgi:hypothetical protein